MQDCAEQSEFCGFGGFGGGGGGDPNDFLNDIFSQFGGGGGGGARGANSPRRGGDIQLQLNITFDEAVKGVSKTVMYSCRAECKPCNGSGAEGGSNATTTCHVCSGSGVETASMQGFLSYQTTCRKCGGAGTIIENPCGICRGQGHVSENRQEEVPIPAGVDDQMELRVPNKGQAGSKGGPSGHLYLVIRVQQSAEFERDGSDVYSTVDISLSQALLGGTVPIKGVLGDKLGNLKVKPGTETGSKLRLRSRGIPKVNTSARGDHFVRFRVQMPRDLTADEKEMILEIADGELSRKGTVEGLDAYIAARDTDSLSAGEGWSEGGDAGGVDGGSGGGILDSITSMFGTGGSDEKSKDGGGDGGADADGENKAKEAKAEGQAGKK